MCDFKKVKNIARFICGAAISLTMFSSVVFSAEMPTPAPKLVSVYVVAPTYPAIARRYNLSGTVLAKIRIEADGHVSRTDILQSPGDVLSKAVVESTARWRYEPIAEPYERLVKIPFQITGGTNDYAFSTDLRPLASPAPTSTSDLVVDRVAGWAQVRALIDGGGSIVGTLVLKSSGQDFARTEPIAHRAVMRSTH